MSKTLILFYTKSGTTLNTAREIQSRLSVETDISDIKKFKNTLDEYSNVILGFPLYAGIIPNAVKKFIQSNMKYLSKKENYIYGHGVLEGMEKNEKSFKAIVKEGLADEYVSKCKKIEHFGGIVDFSKMNIFKKVLLDVLLKYYGFKKGNINTVDKEKINKFIDDINKQ